MEAQVVVCEMARRFPDLDVSVAQAERTPNIHFRGLASLAVALAC